MTCYRIKDWARYYENNRTRELKYMEWLPLPNKQDGDGYTLLVARENGAALFGAWVAVLQVASKCDPRGTLLREGGIPHDPSSLSRITRIPLPFVEEMLNLCVNESKWMEIIEKHDAAGFPHLPAGTTHLVATERNGTERNGISTPKPPKGASEGEAQRLVRKWYKRRDDTPWNAKEQKSWKGVIALSTPADDLTLLDAYYTATIPGELDIRRRDVVTLLNNWNGEIDRARRWQSTPQTLPASVMALQLRQLEERISKHPANRESAYHDPLCPEEKKVELRDLRVKLCNLKGGSQ